MSDTTTRKHLEATLADLAEVLDKTARDHPDFARWWATFEAGNAYLAGARPGATPEAIAARPPALTPPWAPSPWRIDRGQIRDRDGNSIASTAYTLGGPEDHVTGRLILAAPALALAAYDLLRRISDMGTWEFARGGERHERERLRQVLAEVFAVPAEEVW